MKTNIEPAVMRALGMEQTDDGYHGDALVWMPSEREQRVVSVSVRRVGTQQYEVLVDGQVAPMLGNTPGRGVQVDLCLLFSTFYPNHDTASLPFVRDEIVAALGLEERENTMCGTLVQTISRMARNGQRTDVHHEWYPIHIRHIDGQRYDVVSPCGDHAPLFLGTIGATPGVSLEDDLLRVWGMMRILDLPADVYDSLMAETSEYARRCQLISHVQDSAMEGSVDDQTGLTESMRAWTFETFQVAWQKDAEKRTKLVFAHQICQMFAESGDGWLYLHGDTGTGKTYLAVAIANVVAARMPVMFGSIRDLLLVRDEAQQYALLAAYRDAPFLVLDDLGAEYPATEHARLFRNSVVESLFDSRFLHNRMTVITSLFDLSALIAECGYTDQIITRISSKTKMHEFIFLGGKRDWIVEQQINAMRWLQQVQKHLEEDEQ